MSDELSTRPAQDIKTDYAEISALAHTHPVAITVNGREDTVLLSHEDFIEQQQTIELLRQRIAVYIELLQSQDDIKNGRTKPLSIAVDEINQHLDDLKL